MLTMRELGGTWESKKIHSRSQGRWALVNLLKIQSVNMSIDEQVDACETERHMFPVKIPHELTTQTELYVS